MENILNFILELVDSSTVLITIAIPAIIKIIKDSLDLYYESKERSTKLKILEEEKDVSIKAIKLKEIETEIKVLKAEEKRDKLIKKKADRNNSSA